MSGTAIDTNVLLDVATPGSAGADKAIAALDAAAQRGPLVIGPVTYAEMVTHFARHLPAKEARHELDLFLHEGGIQLVPLSDEAAATAGRAYAKHVRDRDVRAMECPACGRRNEFACAACGRAVAWRAHILTDFLVGAHALHTTGVLLTRDRALYRKVPGLRVIAP